MDNLDKISEVITADFSTDLSFDNLIVIEKYRSNFSIRLSKKLVSDSMKFK